MLYTAVLLRLLLTRTLLRTGTAQYAQCNTGIAVYDALLYLMQLTWYKI